MRLRVKPIALALLALFVAPLAVRTAVELPGFGRVGLDGAAAAAR